ncbi:hypothetical protein SLS59_006965 [Nothophoma quercina]|uniref:Uncharacterized protein n=1 Tax=Nothophoma quercina TaxID=749835 RepID=A0ABR3R1I7_9PLEO
MADKEEKPTEQPTEQPKGGDHIPTDTQEEDEEPKQQGGLLSKIGDPVGSVLGTALRPIGAPLEKGLTGPLGNAVGGTTRPALGPLLGEEHEKSELLGGKNKDSYESKPESIAGKEQTGENPLGLDQTGRWGFADDKK